MATGFLCAIEGDGLLVVGDALQRVQIDHQIVRLLSVQLAKEDVEREGRASQPCHPHRRLQLRPVQRRICNELGSLFGFGKSHVVGLMRFVMQFDSGRRDPSVQLLLSNRQNVCL